MSTGEINDQILARLDRIALLLELHVIQETRTIQVSKEYNPKLNLRMKELHKELWDPLPDQPDLRAVHAPRNPGRP